jgi:predicted DNA-binding protein (MmcQ/YjbR family)
LGLNQFNTISFMHIEEFHAYCGAKAGAEASFPFGDSTLVYKVMGKIFALTGIEGPGFLVNLKCDPAKALELRERYPEVRPGYHMSKTHWNTVDFEGSLPDAMLRALIDDSYMLVLSGLPRKTRALLDENFGAGQDQHTGQ